MNILKKNKKLNIEFFIAKRISKKKNSLKQYSSIISRLCIIAITSSLAIIIIAVCLGEGLKKNIENNFTALFSNIRIENYKNNDDIYENETFMLDNNKLKEIESLKEINHIQPVLSKFTALSKEKNLTGAIFLGVNSKYKWDYIDKKIIKGKRDLRVLEDSQIPEKKYPLILISSNNARKLEIDINDTIDATFARIKDNSNKELKPGYERCIVSGIYQTDIKDYDDKICFIDMDRLRERLTEKDNKINKISYYEIFLKRNKDADIVTNKINKIIKDSTNIQVIAINEKFSWLFQWIELFNNNILYITIIMLIICIINMISFLIILVLERSEMIGILKSFGTKNMQIGKIFLYRSINITLKSIFLGNIIGLSICLIQKEFNIIQLNPESYFVNTIPVLFPWETIIQINILAFILIQFAILIPYYKITKLETAKILKIK